MATPEKDIVARYFEQNYRVVFWKDEGSQKGPTEDNWPDLPYTLQDYKPKKHRVGLITGVEIAPQKFLHDIDIDWADGSQVAQKLLPNTDFVFGRTSKRISHCFYTTPTPIVSFRFEDIDGTSLLEIRGVTKSGTLRFQTMVPPSIWESKEQPPEREPLTFQRNGNPAHLESEALLTAVRHAAISMLLSKHFGYHGFGHEPRLAWAGWFLRLGFTQDDLIRMGEAISIYCHNTEIKDVRTTITSTIARLENPNAKVRGGPSLAKFLGPKGKLVLRRVLQWLGKGDEFVRNKDGAILKDHQENVKRAIEILETKLSYNEFADKLLINDQPMEDRHLTALWLRIDEELQFRPSFEFFDKMVRHLAWENSFHPVKTYLDSLTWDHTPRINDWLVNYAQAEAEPRYLAAVSAIVLIAAVRRVRSPGCKYDEMLVLESPTQGTEKSSAVAALCPDRNWFSDDLNLNVKSQQLIEATLGKWIIEASDLAGKRKADIEQLKAMLSRSVDGPARMAYARLPIERPRHFIWIGTTNNRNYLPDSTGARRFWPVRIGKFDIAALIKDRDQLWAEAAFRESEGESIRLSKDLWDVAGEEQEKRREIDSWEDAISEIVDHAPVEGDGRIRIETSVLWDLLEIDLARRDRYAANRLAEIMHRLGFERTRLWSKELNRTVVGYVGPQTKLPLIDRESFTGDS